MFCSEWSLVKWKNLRLSVLPLRCKCWTCEECAARRKADLIADCCAGQPDIFITLTSRYIEGGDPHLAAVKLSHAWRQVRKEYLRAHGPDSLPFMAVFEATKRGWPHLHICGRCDWISQKWLSKRMGELIDSPNVWVERLQTVRKIANYVAKYCGKNPHRFKGVKRYWRSLAYIIPLPAEPSCGRDLPNDWKIVRERWLDIASRYELAGLLSEETWKDLCRYYGVPP